MESPVHTMNALFEQLGLGGSDSEIDAFIQKYGPLAQGLELHEASIWNAAQSSLLQEMIEHDADWAEVVDQLDARLR